MDIQLVTDVLTLSSIVQVGGDWVRMGGWENFVLPDAAPSRLENGYSKAHAEEYQQNSPAFSGQENGLGHVDEPVERNHNNTHTEGKSYTHDANEDANGEGDGDLEVEEDDEEEVVFVMGQEAGWSPEHSPYHARSAAN